MNSESSVKCSAGIETHWCSCGAQQIALTITSVRQKIRIVASGFMANIGDGGVIFDDTEVKLAVYAVCPTQVVSVSGDGTVEWGDSSVKPPLCRRYANVSLYASNSEASIVDSVRQKLRCLKRPRMADEMN